MKYSLWGYLIEGQKGKQEALKEISEEKTQNKMIRVKIYVSVILCKHFNAELRIKRKKYQYIIKQS